MFVALTLNSCGSAETQPPAPNNLISQKELAQYPRDSARRSFLEFWSDLQYQAWADAAAFYSPRFRDFIGTGRLIGAKKVDASIFPLTKPEIVRISQDGSDTTISYSLILPDGSRELGSTTWRRIDGNWQMIYDSRLDAQLNQFARNQVEIEENGAISVDPTHVPSPEVSRAGTEASHLQAEFLEQELDGEAP